MKLTLNFFIMTYENDVVTANIHIQHKIIVNT